MRLISMLIWCHLFCSHLPSIHESSNRSVSSLFDSSQSQYNLIESVDDDDCVCAREAYCSLYAHRINKFTFMLDARFSLSLSFSLSQNAYKAGAVAMLPNALSCYCCCRFFFPLHFQVFVLLQSLETRDTQQQF